MAVNDDSFNELYPESIKALAFRHWTPVEVAKLASDYLVEKSETKVLDIGSGVGKFCFVGAATTNGSFFGVEQRKHLITLCNKIAVDNKIYNTKFIHSNITEIDFSDFDSFYFFNPFYENIDKSLAIDQEVLPEEKLFFLYTDYVTEQLGRTKKGTRLVTYWSTWTEIPESFDLELTAFDGRLNFWKKRN